MSKREEYDHNLKILLIGNSGVGKSCLLMRFSEGKFTQNFLNTIGVDFKVKIVEQNGEKWDTAGQQRFRTITNSYYRNANGIVIVYDITDRQSFQNVSNWYDEMNKNINQRVGCMLVGNKLDMNSRRTVAFQEGQALAFKYNIPFAETSAKTSQNVNELFGNLTRQIIKLNEGNKDKQRLRPPPLPIKQNQHQQQYCKCCQN